MGGRGEKRAPYAFSLKRENNRERHYEGVAVAASPFSMKDMRVACWWK